MCLLSLIFSLEYHVPPPSSSRFSSDSAPPGSFLGITYIFAHLFFLAAFDSALLVGFYPDVAVSVLLDDFLCHDRLRARILNANMKQLYQFMMLHGLEPSSSTRKQHSILLS
jgi:hypothetical protein